MVKLFYSLVSLIHVNMRENVSALEKSKFVNVKDILQDAFVV